jgi:hypothetical protein
MSLLSATNKNPARRRGEQQVQTNILTDGCPWGTAMWLKWVLRVQLLPSWEPVPSWLQASWLQASWLQA